MIAVGDPSGTTFLDSRVRSRRPAPGWLPEGAAQRLCSTLGGCCWAVLSRASVRVTRGPHPVAVMAHRPPAEWPPDDHDMLRAALADSALPLLRDCCGCRFGAEVWIGNVGSLPAPDALAHDDVAVPPIPAWPDGDGEC